MSGFTFPEGSGEKIWNNIVVPGARSLASSAYGIARPMVDQWAAEKMRRGTKRVLESADSYFTRGMSRNQSRAFESQGYSPAPEFQHWTQSSRATEATSTSRSINGQKSSADLSDGVTCPAMFNPGRGAELGLVNKLIDTPLKFRTGEPAGPPRPQDAFSSQLQLYRGVRLNHSFAFKCLVPVQPITGSALVNRGYVHNVFRHYNYVAIGTGTSALDLMGPSKAQWNNTLGPDGGNARAFPLLNATAVTALTTAGLNVSLNTPYRAPAVGAIMYSRMTQQFLENVGWAAHPFKYVQGECGGGDTLTVTNPVVYSNCGPTHVKYPKSFAAQQPYTSGTSIDGKIHSSPYYYRSQFGKGKVAYDFSNDGTCPVVIDVVINKVKQGQAWKSAPVNPSFGGNADLLDNVYKNGYLRMATVNRNFMGVDGMNGQPILNTDCLTNARCEFMPKAALKYSQNQPETLVGSNPTEQQPFKQVARDQFIISAGASRAWTFDLPSLDYDARRYGNRNSSIVGNETTVAVDDICCDFTYIVSIAYSAVSTPLFETPTGATAKSAIIDRRPGDCNVSVTGSYEEFAHPVYLGKDTLTTAYINGALDVPFYGTAPTAGTLGNQEIANLSQVQRGSTPGSAIISVGAINTLSGA